MKESYRQKIIEDNTKTGFKSSKRASVDPNYQTQVTKPANDLDDIPSNIYGHPSTLKHLYQSKNNKELKKHTAKTGRKNFSTIQIKDETAALPATMTLKMLLENRRKKQIEDNLSWLSKSDGLKKFDVKFGIHGSDLPRFEEGVGNEEKMYWTARRSYVRNPTQQSHALLQTQQRFLRKPDLMYLGDFSKEENPKDPFKQEFHLRKKNSEVTDKAMVGSYSTSR